VIEINNNFMAEPNKLDQLVTEIKELIKKLDKPKKDIQGWLTILTSFLASVVIAGLTLYYSNKESVRGAEERKQSFAYNQIRDSLEAVIRQANLRVYELQALKDLIPLLANKDSATRAIAIQLLKASSEEDRNANSSSNTNNNGLASEKRNSVVIKRPSAKISIIDRFYSLLAIAQSSSEPNSKRQEALKEAEPILTSKKISEVDKRRGLTIVSEIAVSPFTPEPIKKTAEDIITNIREISLEELPGVLSSEKVTRPINNIILHHVGNPFTTAKFQGASTILNIAKFQTSQLNWNRISWHYAISPNGSIWLGMPLNEMAIHAKEQNKTSVAILLIMDGDKELPTPSQKATVSALIKLLFAKLNLEPRNFHSHRFYDQTRSCPGRLMTEEYISDLVK
jgi:hypothetical protein